MTHRLRIRLEAGASCRLRGHRAYTCPLPCLAGVTFILLADAQDVGVLHGYDRTADIIRGHSLLEDERVVLPRDVGCAVHVGVDEPVI